MKGATASRITLHSNDGVKLDVDKTLAIQSKTIKNLIEQGHDNIVHVNMTGWILYRVIQYWNLQITSDDTKTVANFKLRPWQANFEGNMDQTMDLAMAANQLNCKELIRVMHKMVENIQPDAAASFFELRGVRTMKRTKAESES